MPPHPSLLKTLPQVFIITTQSEGNYRLSKKMLPGRMSNLLILPGSILFEHLFPPTAERDGGIYDLLYQNSIRKDEDDLKY